MKNVVFHCLVEERKQKRQKIGEKVFPPRFTFFILPNWKKNEKGKVIRNAFYTNTSTLLYSPTPLTFPLLYNKDIIVNLYKLHFPSSFPPLQPNTHEEKLNLFYPPTNCPSSHFSTPTKRTIKFQVLKESFVSLKVVSASDKSLGKSRLQL